MRHLMGQAAARPLSFKLAIFVACVCVALLAIETWRVGVDRAVEIRQSSSAALNLARSLARNIDDTLEIAEDALMDVQTRMESGRRPIRIDEIETSMRDFIHFHPRVSGLFAFDARGELQASGIAVRPPDAAIADRPYFHHHMRTADRATLISPGVESLSRGAWVVPVSRRLDNPDGSFAGVVVATIDMNYFVNLFRSFDLGRTGSISLIRGDGKVVARHPFDAAHLARDISATPLFTEHLPKSADGVFAFTSMLDGVHRLNGYARGARFPVVVTGAFGMDEALADWRGMVMTRLFLVLGVVVTIASLGIWLVRQTRRRQDSESALARLAATDGLTGLANRRRFDEQLETNIRDAVRDGAPLSLILLDIDRFKLFSDGYGHLAGDDCLRRVAVAVAGCAMRPRDFTARYGGEEIAIILPQTTPERALQIAERMRAAVMELRIAHALNLPFGQATASFGVAGLASRDALSLVADADRALYEAKAAGRNCVRAAAAPGGTPDIRAAA